MLCEPHFRMDQNKKQFLMGYPGALAKHSVLESPKILQMPHLGEYQLLQFGDTNAVSQLDNSCSIHMLYALHQKRRVRREHLSLQLAALRYHRRLYRPRELVSARRQLRRRHAYHRL